MNNSPILASTKSKNTLFRKWVFNLLGNMPLGSLEMYLPEGDKVLLAGKQPGINATIYVRDNDFFRKCILFGDIGFGEAYVDGDWDTDDIRKVITWFLQNVEYAPTLSGSARQAITGNLLKWFNRACHFMRKNTLTGSEKNIREHYDLSNDFFRLFLDEGMTYSSALYTHPEMGLAEAQYQKYDRLCRQLRLSPGDHVLEIGSGWGSMAIHVATQYGCRVTTVTISREQYNLAKERIEKAGLSNLIDLQLCDYRHLKGSYDKIVSIEMLEAVGHDYLPVFFKQCRSLLKKNGLLAVQVITSPDSRYQSFRKNVDWIQKHIFPGSLLPSIAEMNRVVNKVTDLQLYNLKEMGLHYGRTLNEWHAEFNRKKEEALSQGFDERFIRKWNYYFCYCEAAFATRNINVVQLLWGEPNSSAVL